MVLYFKMLKVFSYIYLQLKRLLFDPHPQAIQKLKFFIFLPRAQLHICIGEINAIYIHVLFCYQNLQLS